MARPMPLESNCPSGCVWIRVPGMEVGLIMASDSETTFEVKLVNNLRFAKKEEVSFVCFSLGERREPFSAIRACSLAFSGS
ncbi:hypothetical protein D8674_030208 [Pyrus ussuriensis x Pyrus communis]|uniref:Uncharacterized protein n=1 Tax=Pyrus ussuriensis x Pyrus communis TaxID=2448454 RepID=A0A5N5EUR7_9ROSA|nr:hypothetical protein D8674_030208 [Pyrus ussuriensis x Pyrus communis]